MQRENSEDAAPGSPSYVFPSWIPSALHNGLMRTYLTGMMAFLDTQIIFMVDRQYYFSSLCDPRPTEGQLLWFMPCFFGPARTWAQRIAAMRPWVLVEIGQFLKLFLEEFGEPGQDYILDKLSEGHAKLPFHVYYEQVSHQEERVKRVPLLSKSPVQVKSPAPATSQAPAMSQVQVPV
ncbi:hypothetical protein AMELA_G00293220 [Ameiurus melas]|uniref:Uncharacterized protein n=1 Tax=Ameiurus melas TaxID=219545 RepID=A0A7J5ZI27_AMEME|nr:hypothetical protein AMELA_G00293220 [Ameiurus melas]